MSQYRISTSRDAAPQRSQTTRQAVGRAAPARSMEHFVRPFETIDSAPPDPPKPRRLLAGEDTDASICAGGPSRFLRQDLEEPFRMPDFSSRIEVIWPDRPPGDGGEGDGDDEGAAIYDEIWREVEVIRIENPEDSEMWVDVERIQSIAFRHFQTGRNVVFRLKN